MADEKRERRQVRRRDKMQAIRAFYEGKVLTNGLNPNSLQIAFLNKTDSSTEAGLSKVNLCF